MSNYHVEPADQPQALTRQAIKSLRRRPGPGHLAPPAAALLDRRRDGRLAARGHGRHDRLPLAEPRRAASAARSGSGRSTRSSCANSSLPIDEGFPAYFPEARAFIVLIEPGPPGVRARARTRAATGPPSTSGRSTSAARTSAASRTRASGTSGSSARATARATTGSGSRRPAPSTARRRGAWTASRPPSTPTAC